MQGNMKVKPLGNFHRTPQFLCCGKITAVLVQEGREMANFISLRIHFLQDISCSIGFSII